MGRPVAVRVEIHNPGPGELWMVGVVDGAEDGVRYPHYRPLVTRAGAVVAAPGPPEDPLVGPLRPSDFRRLPPGAAFDPTQRDTASAYLPLATFGTFQPAEPGRYRFALTVSTESDAPEQWLGRFGQDADRAAVLALVAKVPRFTVTAHLDVEVR